MLSPFSQEEFIVLIRPTLFYFHISRMNFGGKIGRADADGDAHRRTRAAGAKRGTEGGAARWVEEATLLPSDHSNPDSFGWSVGMNGDQVVVGATGTIDDGPASGSAYVFRRDSSTGWSEQEKLTALDAGPGQKLGLSVAIDGDLVAAGRIGNPWSLLYERVGRQWGGEVPLSSINTNFAQTISLSGNFAAVATHLYAVRNRHALSDFAGFQNCFRPSVDTEPSPACQPYDLTADGIVDLDDYEVFIGTFVGP